MIINLTRVVYILIKIMRYYSQHTGLLNYSSKMLIYSRYREGMATHSSILIWRIPGTEEPGGLPSMGLHRAGHD